MSCSYSAFIKPDLRSLLVQEVPKFLGAMRQTTSRKMLHKLLTRLKVRSIAYMSMFISYSEHLCPLDDG